MYHSITFGDKNTWDDWHLIPASRPSVSPPVINQKTVQIPGADGLVDLTSVLTGYPTHKNRTGTWQFLVMHQYWPDWVAAYTTVLHYLHGKSMKVVLQDDPGFYYEGRLGVNAYKTGQSYSSIAITYSFAPYKKSITSSSEDWLWDVLDFYEGIIYDKTENIVVNGQTQVQIEGIGDQRVIPTITCSAPMTINVNGIKTFTLAAGENRISRIKVQPGNNTFTFTGNGTVTVDYRGGVL